MPREHGKARAQTPGRTQDLGARSVARGWMLSARSRACPWWNQGDLQWEGPFQRAVKAYYAEEIKQGRLYYGLYTAKPELVERIFR